MRLFPIVIAIVVSALIYVFIFERRPATEGGLVAPQGEAEAGAAQPDQGDGARAAVRVVVSSSPGQIIDGMVLLRGRTEAERIVELRSQTSGLVISKPLPKGSFVAQGDVLCRLDLAAREAALAEAQARLAEAQTRVPEAEARVIEAQALYEEAEINANAAENLVKGGFASQSRVAATRAARSSAQAAVQSASSGLKAARAGIEAAQAAIVAAETEIERLSITAPFSGVLESDTAEIGSLMQPGTLCATVFKLDPIRIVGFVSEMQVSRVVTGAKATVRLASGETAEGHVFFVARSADDSTRTFRVEVIVANPDFALRDGETAEIIIGAEGKMAHLLPQSSLTLNDAGTLGVRIVDEEKRAKFLPVTILRDSPEGIWLTGLPDKVDVIVIGQEFVTDGVAVEPSYQDMRE